MNNYFVLFLQRILYLMKPASDWRLVEEMHQADTFKSKLETGSKYDPPVQYPTNTHSSLDNSAFEKEDFTRLWLFIIFVILQEQWKVV